MKGRVLIGCVVALALVAVACGGDTSVGSAELKQFKGNVGGALRDTTTTTALAVPPTGRAGIGGATTTVTAARVTTTLGRPQSSTLPIAINPDNNAEGYFSPTGGRVQQGAFIVWTNRDTQPRSVKADNGAFSSPSLQPGQSFSWTANVLGHIDYHDGTRPYATGFVEVVAK